MTKQSAAVEKYALYLANFKKEFAAKNFEKIRSKVFHDEGYEPTPLSFSQWCLENADIQGMQIAAARNIDINHVKIAEALGHVGGDPNAPLLNPQYMANAEHVRESNKARGHDRDEVLKRTIDLERAAESTMQFPEDWAPKKEKPRPSAKLKRKKSAFDFLFGWIYGSGKTETNEKYISRNEFFGEEE